MIHFWKKYLTGMGLLALLIFGSTLHATCDCTESLINNWVVKGKKTDVSLKGLTSHFQGAKPVSPMKDWEVWTINLNEHVVTMRLPPLSFAEKGEGEVFLGARLGMTELFIKIMNFAPSLQVKLDEFIDLYYGDISLVNGQITSIEYGRSNGLDMVNCAVQLRPSGSTIYYYGTFLQKDNVIVIIETAGPSKDRLEEHQIVADSVSIIGFARN